MSKCALDIRKDIVGNVGKKLKKKGAFVDGDVGYFPNPNIASSAINNINKEFNSLIVKESEKGSFFIDPSDDLVNAYYEQYLMEQEALTMQAEEIARGGYTEEQRGEFFQLEETVPLPAASEETLKKVKEVAKKMGIDIQDLATYARRTGLDITSVNGVTDLVRGVIAIANGKEDVALTEEMVHIATAILEQTNPALVTEMISKIDRFEIYKKTLKQYKDRKEYQLPDGKPNIRKIKKEAVDKLITELIVNGSEGSLEFPELSNEANRSFIRNLWQKVLDFIKGTYRAANIDVFSEAASAIMQGQVGGDVTLLDQEEIYFQLSEPQKNLQAKILETRNKVKKRVLEEKAVDPLLVDSEEASNFYEVEKPDGTFARVKKRVTDRVKDWYNLRFRGKIFTEEEKKFNNFKRELGIKGHGWFEEIHGRFFNSDGTRKSVPSRQVSTLNTTDQTMYNMLQNYYTDLIDSFSKDGKQPLVFSEVIVYDPKEKGGEAGTIDLLIVEESGKAHIIDWKFMSIGKDAQDVAWYKQGAYNVQLGRYKEILRTRYGIKEFGYNRAIPILMEFSKVQPNVEKSPLYLSGLSIGSVDTRKITDVRLIPVSEETESTGYEALDKLLKELNAVYKQISKKVVTDEEERQFKLERLNVLKRAMRIAQGTMNLKDLVDVVRIMRKEGQNIMDDYNLIYKGKAATAVDSTNNELSDFAANMRDYLATAEVFSRVDDLIGDLIYKAEWEKMNLTEEQREQLPGRKELLDKLMQETKQIRKSKEEIKKASQDFADKHIGERNLVTGLLKAEAVIKGLGSTFRGVSELPLNSLKILFKLVTNAKGRAAQDALGEVNKLIELRKKLADRGGNLKELVQRIYQRDSKDKIVNKLIYKYSKEFFDKVKEIAATGGDKQWLLNNIDVEAYKEEAYNIMNERIARIENIYDENEELRDKLIKEEKQKWDITRTDFNGWDNYVIKRHPLSKWYSKEYVEMSKDKDLLELYNFVSDINNKAKEVGYISNKVASTFLPFVRKTMAESLAWDFGTSAIANFGKALKINADDVGYGGINELTGELENSIPKYYTYDFTRGEDGVNDYSDVSEDFFKNMILYINHMEKYKYLSEVEDQIALVKTVETFKNHLVTNRSGDVVYKGGKTEELRGNEENVKIFDDFTRALLYEQKYPLTASDSPINIGQAVNFMKKAVNKVAGKEVFTINDNPSPTSLVKTMDAMNKAFQLKVLGFEPFSGLINAFGANIQLATQAGYYFDARDVLKNELKLTGNRFINDEEREMFIQMIDTFMPLKDDPTYDKLRESGLTALTRRNFSDMLMVFMREPEQHIEKSIFLTLLENTMVENGKIVGIREYVKGKNKGRYDSAQKYREAKQEMDKEIEELKKTRSIAATKKLENGKLVIPGLDLTNRDELQRLTNLTRRISRNAMGSLSDGDINRMQMNIWTRSMMVFKNWIPKLVDTRFGEFRKVADDFSVEIGEDGLTTGEKYDIGRIRLWFYVIGTSIRDRTSNIYNILSVNDKGIEALDRMYDEFKEKFEKETGQDFTMDREEFFDLIRTNLRNQMKELAILLTLVSSFFALGMAAPDDDKDRATKNRFRYYQKILDKAIGELTFFYNPAEFQKILTGAFLPSASLFSDISRFVDHTIMETTGIDTSDPSKTPEQVKKEAQPIKNAAKMFPFTKSLVTWMAIIDPEFAKEYDVTIQKQSRR